MRKKVNEIRVLTKVIVSGKLKDEERSIKFSGFEHEKNGKIIAQSTAQTLVKKYWNWKCIDSSVDNVYVDFNERIISLLLSQKECSGIRCYFAKGLCEEIGKEPKTTLVLVGIKSNGDDIGTKRATPKIDINDPNKSIILEDISSRTINDLEPALIVEVGGGNNIDGIRAL